MVRNRPGDHLAVFLGDDERQVFLEPRHDVRCRLGARSRTSRAGPRSPRCRCARSRRRRPVGRAASSCRARAAAPRRRACPSPLAPRASRRRCAARGRRCRARGAPSSPPARARRRRAPRRRSVRSASARASAASSTTGPRLVFTRYAVGFISPSSRSPIRCRVSGVSGTWSETTSAAASSSSSGVSGVCTTSIPCARASPATAQPILPKPTMPSVFPARPSPSMNVGAQSHGSPARTKAVAFDDAPGEREHRARSSSPRSRR